MPAHLDPAPSKGWGECPHEPLQCSKFQGRSSASNLKLKTSNSGTARRRVSPHPFRGCVTRRTNIPANRSANGLHHANIREVETILTVSLEVTDPPAVQWRKPKPPTQQGASVLKLGPGLDLTENNPSWSLVEETDSRSLCVRLSVPQHCTPPFWRPSPSEPLLACLWGRLSAWLQHIPAARQSEMIIRARRRWARITTSG